MAGDGSGVGRFTGKVPQRVLLVGDGGGRGGALASALVEDGYEVTHTETESQLLECLHAIAECKLRAPSAVVLAARLSEDAGDALFGVIAQAGWRLPVVFAGGPGRYRGHVPAAQALLGPVAESDMRAVVRAVCSSPQLTLH